MKLYYFTFLILWTFIIKVENINLTVDVLDYHNPSGKAQNGYKCETFHIFDQCDVQVWIEVFQKNDIIKSYKSKRFDNMNEIDKVGSFNVVLNEIPITLLFSVIIFDIDNHRHQLLFKQNTTIQFGYKKKQTIKIMEVYSSINLRFTLSEYIIKKKPKVQLLKSKDIQETNEIEVKKEKVPKSMLILVAVLFMALVITIILTLFFVRKYKKSRRRNRNLIQYVPKLDDSIYEDMDDDNYYENDSKKCKLELNSCDKKEDF